MRKKTILLVTFIILAMTVMAVSAIAQEVKIGYVDLRRAFYEYEKSKTYDAELNKITEARSEKRADMVSEIRNLRDQAELLKDQARAEKQKDLDAKIAALNEYDKATRQELLNKKNEMFKEVIDDIQTVVTDIGKTEAYDYVLDSRNIMYAKEQFDLTDRVLEKLNKK